MCVLILLFVGVFDLFDVFVSVCLSVCLCLY